MRLAGATSLSKAAEPAAGQAQSCPLTPRLRDLNPALTCLQAPAQSHWLLRLWEAGGGGIRAGLHPPRRPEHRWGRGQADRRWAELSICLGWEGNDFYRCQDRLQRDPGAPGRGLGVETRLCPWAPPGPLDTVPPPASTASVSLSNSGMR